MRKRERCASRFEGRNGRRPSHREFFAVTTRAPGHTSPDRALEPSYEPPRKTIAADRSSRDVSAKVFELVSRIEKHERDVARAREVYEAGRSARRQSLNRNASRRSF